MNLAVLNPLAALTFEPSSFGWLGGIAVPIGVAAVVLAYLKGLRWQAHRPVTRAALLALRLGAVVCVLLSLLHPAWITERIVRERPVLAVVLDDSESMARPVGAGRDQAGVAPASRYDHALRILRERLMPLLEETHRVWTFDVQARALDPDELPAAPTDDRSPLTDTLLRVQQDLRSQPVTAMVLLSDGRETSDQAVPRRWEQLHVPVHTIDVAGSPSESAGPPDWAIQAVSANRRALVGNTVQVVVDITGRGLPPAARADQAGAMSVSILDGERVVSRRAVTWRPDEPALRAQLEFIPRRPGEFAYTVQLAPLPGEVNLSDNRETFPLTVWAEPLTVLYIDGVLRWEGKFVRQALETDPDINVVSSVRTVRPGADRGSQGLLLAEQLANVNVVILGDVEATYFAREELDALSAWVTESGGALVLTGGYHSFGPTGFGRTRLQTILPVEFSAAENPQIEQPFSFKLTEAGREHPIFHLTGDRVRDTAFFQSLPPLAGCSRIAAVKPAALVLAVDPQITGPQGSQGLPIMVVQQVGAGRTMVFAVDTTWRWRMVVGGFAGDSSFYQRFWGQLVRYMASKEDSAAAQLVVSTNRSGYRLGQTIELHVELRDPQSSVGGTRPAPEAARPTRATPWRVTADAMDETGQRMDVPLAELGASKYRGTLAASRPGRLDLMVSAEPAAADAASDEGPKVQSQVVTVQIERPDVELLNAQPDPQWLAQVAQLTGGRSIKPEQIESWVRQLPADPIESRSTQSIGLWRHPALAATFFAALCTEWILRRWKRLA